MTKSHEHINRTTSYPKTAFGHGGLLLSTNENSPRRSSQKVDGAHRNPKCSHLAKRDLAYTQCRDVSSCASCLQLDLLGVATFCTMLLW